MDPGIEIGSPSGMAQLIHFFEVQSERLDRQSLATTQSSTACLNSQYESLIKFDGVPILAPAMTSSRREALRHYKKDAVLLEKKLKVRQRRQQKMSNSDGHQAQSKHPSSPGRSAVRQLNFDSGIGEHEMSSHSSTLRQRLGATNPLSTFATADLAYNNIEDVGLRTMDSVNSDMMSLEESNLPTVFSGHTLKSVKEQKISYNLDHLCKELNVQDLGSTSGSDLSDALANTREMLMANNCNANNDLVRDEKWAEKVASRRGYEMGNGADVQGLSFCHESQDTVVEVSPDAGSDGASNIGGDNSSTSGFVEKTTTQSSSNFEQTQTSIGSSPGCGSANTSDSQRSKVHFASFILEYNTSASQSLESTTVIKKKMSPSEMRESVDSDGYTEEGENKLRDNWRGHAVVSRAKSSLESKGKANLSRKVSNESSSSGSSGLLNRVSLQHDSDMSLATPPYNSSVTVPFQNYGLSNEGCNSDKENDGSRITRQHQDHRHARQDVDHSSRHRESPDHQNSNKTRVKRVSSESSETGEYSNNSVRHRVSSVGVSDSPTTADMKSYATGGMGSAISQTALPPTSSSAVSVGASQLTTMSCDSDNLVSISQVSLGLQSSGIGSAANQQSVSDSQTSSARSTTLTGTSGSSSSTIKEDPAPKNVRNLEMNIVEGGNGHVQLQSVKKDNETVSSNDIKRDRSGSGRKSNNDNLNTKDSHNNISPDCSPKRLNTDNQTVDGIECSTTTTPKQLHVRRGSYTLTHPSPALLKAKGRMEVDGEKEKYEDDDKEKCSVSSGDENISPAKDETSLKKKLDFQELIQDLEETSVDHENNDKCNSKEVLNNSNVPSNPEKDGKAEHINKYLRHVQFQNSMNLQSIDPEQSLDVSGGDIDLGHHDGLVGELEAKDQSYYGNVNDVLVGDGGGVMAGDDDAYIMSVLQSIADSQSSVGKLSDLEVQTLHQQQMELARRALVEQQRKDMEELFVQQRREIMKFETEIRMAQHQSLEQHNFLVQNAPENLKVKARNHENEFSPDNTANLNLNSGSHYNYKSSQQHNSLSSMNSIDNMRPQSTNRQSFNEHHPPAGYPSLNLQPKSYPSMGPKPTKPHGGEGGRGAASSRGIINSLSSKSLESVSNYDHHPSNTKRAGNLDGGYHNHHYHHHHHRQRVHNISATDLSDIGYTIPEFGSPSVSSPRMHHKIAFNYGELHSRRNGAVSVPPEAYHPNMQTKFDRISAVAKGFLTRCLMRSDKVQGLLKTIKDTREFFVNFQTETPIKKGNITMQDKALMERIQAQLQGAKFDIHEIFFDLSIDERMALIEQTRVKEYVKKSRDCADVSRASGPRMSQATLKALERKRKAREAEAIAILSTSTSSSLTRPKTGNSSNNNSPRCQNHTDGRALKPLQAQHHHPTSTARSGSNISNNKDKKEKPQNAPEKQLTRPRKMITTQSSSSKPSSSTSQATTDSNERDSGLSKPTASTTVKVSTKTRLIAGSGSSSNNAKPASRPTKSWR